jgi:hypothetical protein
MERAPSARRGAVWLAIDAIVWLIGVGMLIFSIAHTNAHNVLPSIIVTGWWGMFVVGIPVVHYRYYRLARKILADNETVR